MEIKDILCEAVRQNASDIHLKVGAKPMLRIKGQLHPIHPGLAGLSKEEVKEFCTELLSKKELKELIEKKELDLAYSIESVGRFRINIFYQRGSLSMVIRHIPHEVPALKSLNLPPVVEKMTDLSRGLVLFTGETGSGKSTSLAAFVDKINKKYHKHIVTIEDPIEYLIPDDKSIITQREIGTDTSTFQKALRASLRQDPDVILIGELRDAETIQTALMAAETGHLVISTLHTTDTRETVLRILSYFRPDQQTQLQFQLASSLKAVISQRLLARADGQGFIPASEILVNNPRISEAIMDLNKLLDMKEILEQGHISYGMQSFDQSLLSLLKRGLISADEAMKAATSPSDFDLKLKGIHNLSRADHPDSDYVVPPKEATDKSVIFDLQLETIVNSRNTATGKDFKIHQDKKDKKGKKKA